MKRTQHDDHSRLIIRIARYRIGLVHTGDPTLSMCVINHCEIPSNSSAVWTTSGSAVIKCINLIGEIWKRRRRHDCQLSRDDRHYHLSSLKSAIQTGTIFCQASFLQPDFVSVITGSSQSTPRCCSPVTHARAAEKKTRVSLFIASEARQSK